MRNKLVTLAIAFAMVCMSLSALSFFTTPTVAEGVGGPFEVKSNGYPIPVEQLDQEVSGTMTWLTIHDEYFVHQSFMPGVSGRLSSVEFMLWGYTGTGPEILHVEVCNVDGNHWPTSTIVDTEITHSELPGTSEWIQIPISNPPELSSGQTYGIKLWTEDPVLEVRVYLPTTGGLYSSGKGSYSPNGVSWVYLSSDRDIGFKTYMTTTEGLTKVAWHESGDYALAVNGLNNSVYRFDRSSGTWSHFMIWDVSASLTVYHDIIYSEIWSSFIAVGKKWAAMALFVTWSEGSGLTERAGGMQTGTYFGVVECTSSYFGIGVGQHSDGTAIAVWYGTGGGVTYVNTGLPADATLQDITTDYAGNYYMVGNTTAGSGIIYSVNDAVRNTALPVSTLANPLVAIEWQPPSGGANYALLTCLDSNGNILKFDGSDTTVILSTTDILYDISWHPNGSMAILVGENAGNGVVYHHHAGTDEVVEMTPHLPSGTGALYGVAVKGPTSPSSGIIVGFSGGVVAFPQASDTGTQVRVNAAFPHVLDVDFWSMTNPPPIMGGGGSSLANSQVDVDSTYTFYVEANYTIANTDHWSDVELNLTAWYDGAVVGFGAYPDATWSLEDARTRQFRVYYNVLNDTAWMNYPLGAPFEFSLDSWYGDPGVYGGALDFWHHVFINVTFAAQTYEAAGDLVSWDPPTLGDIWDPNFACNDQDSWNFMFGVYDVNYTGAIDMAFDEFGINEAVSISVTGNPTLSAPPGTGLTVMTNPSLITYSSNRQYWVNVSLVDNLLLNGVGPANIAATNIRVWNANGLADPLTSDISGGFTPFAGPGIDQVVWGTSGPVPLPVPLNGTTATGDWGSNFNGYTSTQVTWMAQVPGGTPEGMYWTTITYTIEDFD